MGYFRHRSNPEAVLNKAKGTVKLGDKDDAWNIISEYLASRNKKGWRQAVDDMMSLFVELCVDLRRSPKDGFIQYRHHCSTLHLDSLERNLRELIEKATKRGDEQHDELLLEFEGKDLKDPIVKKEYTKRQFSLPSLKFQWSTYRCVLDVLRNNQKLDPLYQDTVRGATRYCVKYNRTSEYRKLCDVNRRHLRWIFEHQTPGKNFVEIGTQNMLSIYLNTRFELLENATKLQLWQEAYRLITDIYELRQRSSAPLDPSLEKNYYNKLAQIFIGSNNVVLHAYAVIRYFVLLRDEFERQEAGMQVKRKKDEEPLTEETIKKLSMKCVLATCATPAPRCRSDTIGPAMNSQDDKFRLMCDKLHFHSRPNQKNLIEQLEKEEICDDLPSLFTEIQNIMIGEHSPLTLCKEVKRVMALIVEANPELAVYVEPMKNACARKLISAVSSMYKSIPMQRLLDMCFEDWTQPDLESMLLELTQQKVIWCSMSHKHQMCTFRAPPRITRNTFMRTYFSNAASEMQRLLSDAGMVKQPNREEIFGKIRKYIEIDGKEIAKRSEQNTKKREKADYKTRFRKYVDRNKKKEELWKQQSKRLRREEELKAQRLKEMKVQQEKEKQEKAANEARVKATKQLELVTKAVKGKIKEKTKVGTKKLKKILNTSDENASKAAIDTLTVDYLQQIKAAQEEAHLETLKFQDYYVRACRREEIPLIRKKNAEILDESGQSAVSLPDWWNEIEEANKPEILELAASVMTDKETRKTLKKKFHLEKAQMKELPDILKSIEENEKGGGNNLMDEYRKRVEELKAEHDQKLELKKLAKRLHGHSVYFLQRIENRREKHYQAAKAIQLERKAKHDEARENKKRKIAEKRQAQMERNQAAKEAERRRMEKMKAMEKPEEPKEPPVAADAGNLGAPRLATTAPGPPRRNADGSAFGAPKPKRVEEPTSGPDAGSWRVADKSGKTGKKRQRPTFINTKKQKETAPKPVPAVVEPEKSTPATPVRPAAPIRPASNQSVRGSVRPPASVRPSSPASVRPAATVRPSAATSVRPQPSVRPKQPSVRPNLEERTSSPLSIRPAAKREPFRRQSLRPDNPSPNPGFRQINRGVRPGAGPERVRPTGVAPSQKKGGWRERQEMRAAGVVDPASAIRERDSPKKSGSSSPQSIRPGSIRPPSQNPRSLRPAANVGSARQNVRPGVNVRGTYVRPGPRNIRPSGSGPQRNVRPTGRMGAGPRVRPSGPPNVRQNSAIRPRAPPNDQQRETIPIQTNRQNPGQKDEGSSPPFQTVTRKGRRRFTNSKRT